MKRSEGYQASPPENAEQLKERLFSIMGKNLSDLASFAKIALPISPLHGKGFQGELMERLLGASAPGLPIPDFPNLGIELKTVPVSEDFKALESTFFCSAPLNEVRVKRFEDSILFHKISRVLFVFLVSPRNFSYEKRYVAGYRFWSPAKEDLALIRQDYEELMEKVALGGVDEISARNGNVIQMRPKAANGRALTDCVGPDGTMIKVRPRGFYMRRAFMQNLIDSFKKSS